MAFACLATGCAGRLGRTAKNQPAPESRWLPARVRRLSNFEYERSVSKLVGAPVAIAGQLPPEVRQAGYTRNADQVVSAEALARIDEVTHRVAHDTVLERLFTIAPCARVPTP